MSHNYSLLTNNRDSTKLDLDEIYHNQDDLTKLFFQMVKKGNPNHLAKNGIYNPPRSTFLETSHEIEKKIRWSTNKLKELEQISGRSSLFSNDDHTINEIIINVKENINQVQSDMINLSHNNDLHYSRDSEYLAKNVTENLNLRFLELTKEFQSALQKRSKIIKKYEEKRSSMTLNTSITKPTAKKYKKGEALFLRDDDVEKKNSETGNLVYIQEHELENEYLKSRSESIKNIEKMLYEVAGIFQRISTLVQMQEVMIDRIDKHTEDTLVNVQKGKKHLINIYTDMTSNRKMIITVFFLLLIFAVMYIVVFL